MTNIINDIGNFFVELDKAMPVENSHVIGVAVLLFFFFMFLLVILRRSS